MEIKPVVLTGLSQRPTLFQGLTALATAFRSYRTASLTRFIEHLQPCLSWALFVSLSIASSFLLGSCKNSVEEVNDLVSKFDTQVETARDVEILYSDSAQVRVRITGPTMLYHLDRREPRQEFPDGIAVDFYGPEGAITSQLDARYALRLENKNEMIVRDSVVWQSVEGEKIESEELIWDERQRKIYTNKFVVITRPDEIIYGHGFEADQDFSYSRINAIEGRLKVDDLEKDLE